MKTLLNKTLLREQLIRYWPIAAIELLAFVLGCLMPIWGAINNQDTNGATHSLMVILELGNPIVIMANIIAPFAAAALLFSYLYRKNAAGVMHALPFSKNQLFATNFLSGYLLIILPLALLSLLLLVTPVVVEAVSDGLGPSWWRPIAAQVFPGGLYAGQVINTVPVVFTFFLRTLLSYTFYYILFVTAAMVVGNALVYMPVSAAFAFLVPGLYSLFMLIGMYFVYGYYTDTAFIEQLFTFTNPVLLTTQLVRMPADAPLAEIPSLTAYYIVYLVIAAVLLALSVWLYRTRRQERAEDSVVFTPLKRVLIFLLSVWGMLMLGTLFLMLLGSVQAMYAGLVIGFIITFFISLMIADKSFRVLYKYQSLIRYGGVALGLYVVIAVACRMDIMGYARYIPDVSEVEGVLFNHPQMVRGYAPDSPAHDLMFISDPDIINETLAAHRRVIDARGEQRAAFLSSLGRNQPRPVGYQQLTYRLKNGDIVSRQYVLWEDFLETSGLSRLVKSEQAIRSEIYWLHAPDLMESITLDVSVRMPPLREEHAAVESLREGHTAVEQKHVDYNTRHFNTIIIDDRSELLSLVEAIQKDYIHSRRNPLIEPFDGEVSQASLHAQMKTGSKMRDYSYYTWIENGAENTFAWLAAHGYALTENH